MSDCLERLRGWEWSSGSCPIHALHMKVAPTLLANTLKDKASSFVDMTRERFMNTDIYKSVENVYCKNHKSEKGDDQMSCLNSGDSIAIPPKQGLLWWEIQDGTNLSQAPRSGRRTQDLHVGTCDVGALPAFDVPECHIQVVLGATSLLLQKDP